ncbi:DNA-binding FadR family transcriptional regulator [Streptomyces sp. B3I7]|uniref:FadR/GntR family transcriptional regulator n=1 Tax=Streptomyces sp. B3I7 TaxID=3042269 RepID=UPI00277D7251|nr:FCD domain-containing protein [Streptomyces sp. B3I7]MDQ0814813.1 DNA-binding FadR family transcriptional regulator [Streptomyces sp. B3I7]
MAATPERTERTPDHRPSPVEAVLDADQRRGRSQGAGAAMVRSGRGGEGRASGSGRAELAAERVAKVIETVPPGSRLGTKEELRTLCEVSVGTFNEALRLLQSRGLVTVKPGPGGGLFSAEQSPMVRLGNSVLALDSQQNDVADAVRIRDALDPLLIEDALWHASPADLAGLRRHITAMENAVNGTDPVAFVHANWRLHAAIASISPNALLSSLYTHLLDLIESHTLSVLPAGEQPLPDYIATRHALHRDLVDALERRDRDEALRLIHEHNTTPATHEDVTEAR